ncbi:MAG: LacI family DNA-binding transcriptional regulator [Pseudomonadota bacterium]
MRRPRSRKGAPGIVEVARRAGVSPATVSRCFNAPDQVKADTRVQVAQAAEALGYIRNRAAGTLHNRDSGSVGLVVPTIDNAIFSELVDAFAHRLRAHDRTLLIATHDYDLEQEVAIVRSLLERRIDGVALVGFDHSDVTLRMLRTQAVPVLSIWNFREDAALPCVGTDNRAAGRHAAQHVIDLGHRHIAFLFPADDGNDRARDRRCGAFEATEAAGITPRLVACPYDVNQAKSRAASLLATDAPTAIVAGNDVIAQGVIYACQARGIAVPQTLSVVGIGDFRGSAAIEPQLSTVRLPARTIGRRAADAMVSLPSDVGFKEPMRQCVPFEWIERDSTAPPVD